MTMRSVCASPHKETDKYMAVIPMSFLIMM